MNLIITQNHAVGYVINYEIRHYGQNRKFAKIICAAPEAPYFANPANSGKSGRSLASLANTSVASCDAPSSCRVSAYSSQSENSAFSVGLRFCVSSSECAGSVLKVLAPTSTPADFTAHAYSVSGFSLTLLGNLMLAEFALDL